MVGEKDQNRKEDCETCVAIWTKLEKGFKLRYNWQIELYSF